jgi:hypothetical protein
MNNWEKHMDNHFFMMGICRKKKILPSIKNTFFQATRYEWFLPDNRTMKTGSTFNL